MEILTREANNIVNAEGKAVARFEANNIILTEGAGGSTSFISGEPSKIGDYTINGEKFELRKCYIEVGMMGNQVPANILESLNITLITNVYAIMNNNRTKLSEVYYDYNTKQCALEFTNIWCERIVIEYVVRVEE